MKKMNLIVLFSVLFGSASALADSSPGTIGFSCDVSEGSAAAYSHLPATVTNALSGTWSGGSDTFLSTPSYTSKNMPEVTAAMTLYYGAARSNRTITIDLRGNYTRNDYVISDGHVEVNAVGEKSAHASYSNGRIYIEVNCHAVN